MRGLNLNQLRFDIVRPALGALGHWSTAAENLVLGTAVVESDLHFIRQLKSGPALGLWQMEPATHNDIWGNYLRYRQDLAGRVAEFQDARGANPDALVSNLLYAAAMCRVHYLRAPAALPLANDAKGMAEYWKQYYNTPLGKGTVDKAIPHFDRVIK